MANLKLFAWPDAPLKLYINDFNKNGSEEQVMAYTIDGKEYSFLGKDQLELIIPQLKKQHLTYDEGAGKTVQYLFGNMFTNNIELKAKTLASGCFINDGKGHFIKKDLPAELQLAPLFTLTSFFSND